MRVANVEKEIDGYTFQIHMLPYGEAKQVLDKAQMLIAAMLNEDVRQDGLSPLMGIVFMPGTDHKDIDFVIQKMAEKTLVKEPGGQFIDLNRSKDIIFTGRMDLMFKWLDAALELNFASFLGELKKLAERQKEREAGSQSPSTLIGSLTK